MAGATRVSNTLILFNGSAVVRLITCLAVLLIECNQFPCSDEDGHALSVKSRPALAALERLMQKFGHTPRFRMDADQGDRTVVSNGTIINHPHPTMFATLGRPGGALGFVVGDPDQAARESAQLLQGYRKPLERWTTFEVERELAGFDDEWVHHIHRFVQQGELRTLGVTRALIGKRDAPTALDDLLQAIGVTESKAPPARGHDLVAAGRDSLEVGRFRSA